MPTALLHQLLAMQGPKLSTADQQVNVAISKACNANLSLGRKMTYEPFSADDKFMPQEVVNGQQQLQVRVADVLASIVQPLADAYDIELSIASANQQAAAPIMFEGRSVYITDDGKPLAVPATHLLFLENRLKGLLKQLQGGGGQPGVAVLDPSVEWAFDDQQGVYKSGTIAKNKMDKLPTVITLAQPTQNHPAQTKVEYVDKPIGNIVTQLFTGAITPDQRNAMFTRIQGLIDAVMAARYKANEMQATQYKQSARLLSLIFEPLQTKTQPATAAS